MITIVSAWQRRTEEWENEKQSVCAILAVIKVCRAVCTCVFSSLFQVAAKNVVCE